jgi:hypothetical protein
MNGIIIIIRESIFITSNILGRGMSIDFYFIYFLLLFAMRYVYFERFRKSDLLDEAFP